MTSTIDSLAPSQYPRRAISGRTINRSGEFVRTSEAALWVQGKLDLCRPTQQQAAAVFMVSPAAVRGALDRAGVPRRPRRKPVSPVAADLRERPAGMLSVDELLTLAGQIEAAGAVNGNGAAHP